MKDIQSTSAGIGPDQDGLTIFDVLLTLCRHLRSLLLIPLLIACVALASSFLLTVQFTATARFLPPQQSGGTAAELLSTLGGAAGFVGSLGGIKSPAEQWVGIAKSQAVADALVDRFNLLERYAVEYRFKAREELKARSSITLGKDSLITVEVEDTDPNIAARMANAYIEELQKVNARLAIGEAAQRRAFFEKQLQEANAKVVKAELDLRNAGISESVIKTSPEVAMERLSELRAKLMAADVRLDVLRAVVTPTSSEWKQAISERDALRAQLAKAMKASPNAGEQESDRGNESYLQRYRDFRFNETLFEIMARQFELAKVDEAKEGAFIQVVDVATVPEWKSSPKRALITVLAGLLTFAYMVIHILVAAALRDAALKQPALAKKLQALREVRIWSKRP